MVNIKLIGDYYIRTDSMNIILVKMLNGRDYVEGYYSSLYGAIETFLQLKIKGSNATSINTLLLELKSLQRSLNVALRPLKLRVVSESEVEND